MQANYRKNTFVGDIQRCPYAPGDPEHSYWIAQDDERLEKLSKSRAGLREDAVFYMAHIDPTIRRMAKFIREFLE
jgi:hypothetical protein